MASEKQILANRRNAKKATGPRSARGKAISSMNALKTGMYAKHLLLPDDDEEEFKRLRLALHKEWKPVGPTETILVERLAALFWKQRGYYRGESGLYAMFRQTSEGVGGVATALARDGQDTEAFTRLLRMDGAVERSIGLTIRLLQVLQKDRGKREGLVEPQPSSNKATGDTSS